MIKFTKFFIENTKLTIVLSLFMLFIGISGLQKMKSETFPSVDFATAIITTVYRGASSSTIETKITKPIEDEIRTVRFIKDVKSVSQPGLSRIIVRLDMDAPGINIPQIMGDLQRAIDRVSDLPSDLENKPLFLEVKSEEFPVLLVALSKEENSYVREEIADDLKAVFEDNKSVKGVALEGYSDREFQIILNSKSLEKNYVGVNEVIQKIALRNLNIPTGLLKGKEEQKLTRIEATVNSVKDLEKVIIRSTFSGGILNIKDVASIKDSRKEKSLLIGYNGKDSTVLSVTKKAGSDTRKIVKDLEKRLNVFKKAHPSVEFNAYYSEANKIGDRMGILTSNALSGLFIIILTLFFFLPWRTAISTSISLPLSLMATLGVMSFMGVNLNTMTILALVIALGMLLDASVVIAENFVRLRENGYSGYNSAIASIKSLWLPIMATALTTVASFLPMLVTKGIMGRFIQWLPIVVSLALMLSLIESFFLLPMRLKYFTKDKVNKSKKNDDWFIKYERKFERLVLWLIQRRKKVLLSFIGLIMFSLFLLFGANKFILFPSDQTEIYIGRYSTKKGTRLEKTQDMGLEMSKKIQATFGKRVKHVIVKAGRTDDSPSNPNYREGDNYGSFYIYVDDIAKNDIPYSDIIKKLYSIKMDGFEKLSFEVIKNAPPIGSPIEVKFRSDNINQLDAIIKKIKDEVSQIEGVSDLMVDDIFSEDEIFISLDYEKVGRLGLTVNQVSQSIRTAIAGTIASDVTLDNKKIDLLVRFEENSRQTIKDLENIKILNKTGYLVPLLKVAKLKKSNATPYIKRYDYKRTKTLIGQVDDKNITSSKANKLIKKLFEKYKKVYPDVSISLMGAAESTKESMESLSSAFKISLIAIFALLVFLFNSYLKPLLIITTIPLGFVGIGIGFFLQGKPVSFMAMIGIVGLSGIIINSGIILISTILDLEKEGKVKKLKLLPFSASLRLRSVLITAFTTIIGLVPTAYGIGGYDSLISPLTLAIVWGLLFGTILTLLWIPCGYALLEDLDKWTNEKNRMIREKVKIWHKKHQM